MQYAYIVVGGNTIVTPPLKENRECRDWRKITSSYVCSTKVVFEVDNRVVYQFWIHFLVVREHIINCLRSCDYRWSNRKHSYTVRDNNFVCYRWRLHYCHHYTECHWLYTTTPQLKVKGKGNISAITMYLYAFFIIVLSKRSF